jgi:hypothetical protein
VSRRPNRRPRLRLARHEVARRARLAWRDVVAPYGLAVAGLAAVGAGGFLAFGVYGWFVAGAAALVLEWRIHG